MNELLMLAVIQLLGAAFVASIARLAKVSAQNSSD